MVLITGATGFLGAHLTCFLLKNGQKVRALQRENSSKEQFNYIANYYFSEGEKQLLDSIEWVIGDVLQIPELEHAMQGVDKIYHCAAMVSFKQKDAKIMHKINVEGTANVVNLALENKVSKLCYVSSTAALGRTGEGKTITEETEWTDSKYNSNYAITKYLAEMEVWRGKEEGLNVVVVNPSVILGVSGSPVGSASIVQKAKNGFPFYTQGQNGFVDVEDVVQIMYRLMESDIAGEQFLCVAENWTFEKLFKSAAATKGLKPPSIRIAPWMAEIGWRVSGVMSYITGLPSLITKETARSSQKTFTYSNEKIKRRLDYTFIPLEVTIKKE